MKLSERQKYILEEAIKKFLETGEPISSKEVSEVSKNFRPSTIRKDMNDLIQNGFLTQLHISSGRIPTEQAFDWYAKNFQIDEKNLQFPSKYSNFVFRVLSECSSEYEKMVFASKMLSDIVQMPTFFSGKSHLEKMFGISKLFRHNVFSKDQLYYFGEFLDNFDEILKISFSKKGFDQKMQIMVGDDLPIAKGAGISVVFAPIQNKNFYFGIFGPVAMNYPAVAGILNEFRSFLN